MNATQQFSEDFTKLIVDAVHGGGVPIEHVILTLDIAHGDMMQLRQKLVQAQAEDEGASKIVAATTIPIQRK